MWLLNPDGPFKNRVVIHMKHTKPAWFTGSPLRGCMGQSVSGRPQLCPSAPSFHWDIGDKNNLCFYEGTKERHTQHPDKGEEKKQQTSQDVQQHRAKLIYKEPNNKQLLSQFTRHRIVLWSFHCLFILCRSSGCAISIHANPHHCNKARDNFIFGLLRL